MIVPGARGLTEGLMRDLGATEVWRNAPVWGLFGRTLAVLRGDRVDTAAADVIILATGARETLLPFPGWTLDGVMTVEAGWEAVRSGRIAAGPDAVIAAGGADAGALAKRLAERGVAAALVSSDRPAGVPESLPLYTGSLAAAEGSGTVERIVLTDGTTHACRMLCVESPRTPSAELARMAGCPCVYQPLLGGWVPRYDPTLALHGPTERLYASGDATGIDSPRAAAESGRLAARYALRALGLLPDPEAKIVESRRRLAAASIPLHARAREALMLGADPDELILGVDVPDETIVCPCEGVTVAALRAAVTDGARTPDDLKRRTRCGMGTCQWRRCGEPVMRWLSGALQTPIGRLPLPRMRPPVRPIPIASLAAAATASASPNGD
jgi:D-hydroxyproline dehydrogenase subunit alpha